MGLFKRGYEASRQEIAKQEENRKKMGNQLFRFFVPAPERGKQSSEKNVVFLTESPVNFEEHTIKKQDGTFDYYTCMGKGCPLCADGQKKTAKAAYLLVDLSHFEYTSKNTGKKVEGDERLMLYVQGMRAVGHLDRIHSRRGGVAGKEITVVRLGSGQNTTYSFEVGDKVNMSVKHVKSLMTEEMAKSWDGSQDGLMDIVEEQLKMSFPEASLSLGRDDDDDEYSEGFMEIDDEDEFAVSSGEEEKPKKSSKSRLSSRLGGKKKKPPKAKSTFKDKPDDDFMEIDDDDEDGVPFI